MNSVLNPEAPEFYPHLTSVTQGGYSSVQKSIRSSHRMPVGASYNLFKTFTDFNVVTCQLSENVVIQANQILQTELPAVKLKRYENELNSDKIADANDSMLDRVHMNMDAASGALRPGELCPLPAACHAPPVVAKIQVGSTMFIGAKNIPRPQVMFKDQIDNSPNLWVPKISDKPNNIKPLALSILYNDDGKAVGYEHPYKVELELYQPPEEFLEQEEEEEELPPPLEETPLTLVETEEQVDELVRHLAGVRELALDLEHHSYRTYQGITCLMQVTTREGGDFIVDALAAREHLHKLNVIFTDPTKLKVLHGAESDVVWLQRDFGLYLVGMFDTHQAARALRLSPLSLKGLLMRYCGVDADKKFQLADWRIRPLPAELVQYARGDTHYLLHVGRRLRSELRAAGLAHLRAVYDASRHICLATYNKEMVSDEAHLALYVRSKKSFNTRQMAALKILYRWRDQHARDLDESPTYLMPNHMVVSVAEALPRELQGVAALCSPTPPFVKQHLITIHRLLLSCRELPLEPQLLQPPGAPPAAAPPPAHHVHDTSHLPDAGEEQPVNLELAWQLASERWSLAAPDVPAFLPPPPPIAPATPAPLVSGLNADAKLFIPPYDRYRKYRALAQIEEIKEFKDKEAKIAALGKGNELIKTEVLIKLQQAKTHIERQSEKQHEVSGPPPPPEPAPGKKQRKRKMSSDKGGEAGRRPHAPPASAPPFAAPTPAPAPVPPKPSLYKNVNYRKFYDDTDKARKQPKMKFKKHK